ncbi:hypothetical protein PRUB_a4534 [Pseudoalteromonas rubra]|uniref:Uncharacterized protein n=1 Tax=Pseudoalteromonas rubra TaxID=43658 RepID=A0A8T0CB93_9GAMM|nr:hypothetical protein [Pseudoalteromonas rubra]KAF7787332.1 hypothetical protein PRUB_a4534 [Pseudoalteromonas rubra]
MPASDRFLERALFFIQFDAVMHVQFFFFMPEMSLSAGVDHLIEIVPGSNITDGKTVCLFQVDGDFT